MRVKPGGNSSIASTRAAGEPTQMHGTTVPLPRLLFNSRLAAGLEASTFLFQNGRGCFRQADKKKSVSPLAQKGQLRLNARRPRSNDDTAVSRDIALRMNGTDGRQTEQGPHPLGIISPLVWLDGCSRNPTTWRLRREDERLPTTSSPPQIVFCW
jgi:hypothetical protein